MKKDEEYWRKEAENRRIQVKYWKDKARNPELTHKLLEIFEADPEMKWFLLWLGAGAVGVAAGGMEAATQGEETQAPSQSSSMDAWDVASWLTGPGLIYNLYKSNNPLAVMTLPGLIGDLAEGDVSSLTLPGFCAKILGNASKANSISAIALAVIIIGRLGGNDGGGGLIGKALAAGL